MPELLQCFWFAACCDDSPGAETLGNLDGQVTSGSGCTQNQNAFARSEMSAMGESRPGRHSWIHHGCYSDIVEAFGNGKAKLARGDTTLREGAERTLRRARNKPGCHLRGGLHHRRRE